MGAEDTDFLCFTFLSGSLVQVQTEANSTKTSRVTSILAATMVFSPNRS